MFDWRIYKEGQGIWARNSVAAVIGILAVWSSIRFYEYLTDPTNDLIEHSVFQSWFGVYSWPFDYRLILVGPYLLALLYFGVWQYNHAKWADFLIDTEAEMKNRVTWPSHKEQWSASVVVIVATVILGGYIFLSDFLLKLVFDLTIYAVI